MVKYLICAGNSKKGCKKRIGNGHQTKMWKVPWLLSVDNGCMTTEMPMNLEGSRVCDLMEIGQQ